MIPRAFHVLLCCSLFAACGDPGPDESVTEAAAATAAVSQEPVTDELPTEQDVVRYTRNSDPATVAPEQLPEVAPSPATAPPTTGNPRPATELPTEQDVVKYTRNSDPATVAPEKLPPVAATSAAEPTASAPTAGQQKPEPTSRPLPQRPMETLAPDPGPAPAAAPAGPDHAPWHALLQRHVNARGDVNYAAFKRDEAQLDAYLRSLAATTPTSDWSRQAAMAYWINAYNAFTVKRILRAYPLASIRDLDGGDPWKVKWIELGGKTYSLNQIEHDILRPRYRDPRIHFAVNCAAASCPPLPNEAFTADNLNALLQRSTRNFIRNAAYNQTSGPVRVSKIFDWYGEDFGDLREYLNKYLREPLPAGTTIGFREYDWALNAQ